MIAHADGAITPKAAWQHWIQRRERDIAADIARQTEEFLEETRRFQSIDSSVFLSFQKARHALFPLLREISEHTVRQLAEELLSDPTRPGSSSSKASAGGNEEDCELRRWQ